MPITAAARGPFFAESGNFGLSNDFKKGIECPIYDIHILVIHLASLSTLMPLSISKEEMDFREAGKVQQIYPFLCDAAPLGNLLQLTAHLNFYHACPTLFSGTGSEDRVLAV